MLRHLSGKARGLRILFVWKGRATPPDGRDRRTNRGSYFCASPKGDFGHESRDSSRLPRGDRELCMWCEISNSFHSRKPQARYLLQLPPLLYRNPKNCRCGRACGAVQEKIREKSQGLGACPRLAESTADVLDLARSSDPFR